MTQRYPTAARIGMRIQVLREQQGLSVRGLAKKAAMPHNNLLKVEAGAWNTPIETLARIARALDVELHILTSDADEIDLSSPHHHVNSWELARLCASLAVPLAFGLPL